MVKIFLQLTLPAKPSDVAQKPTCLSENGVLDRHKCRRMGGGNQSMYKGHA